MIKNIIHFFDKLEDKIRHQLSHHPLLYALIGGVGVVLFWKGVWDIADTFSFMYGITSLLIGTLILLLTGVFVSAFIGSRLIISGLKGEKTLAEKTEDEVRSEESEIKHVEKILSKIEGEIADIETKISSSNK